MHMLIERLSRQFPGIEWRAAESYGMPGIEVPAEMIIPVVEFLKNDPVLQMNFLTDLTAVHYPDEKGRELAVVYHLQGFVNNLRLRIKAFIPVANPEIDSLTGLFSAANWMERETYDFFGIQFKGHPDLRRILNVDDMDYFPLRKEYPLEDATRKDKDDRFFGRQGHEGVEFDKRVDRR